MEAFLEWVNPTYSLSLCIFFAVLALGLFIYDVRKDRKARNTTVEEYTLVRYNGERITLSVRDNEGDLEFVQINRFT